MHKSWIFHCLTALFTLVLISYWGSMPWIPVTPVRAASLQVPDANLQLLQNIKQVTAGASHTCALTIMGGVKCWGNNHTGQLGNGSLASFLTPVDVSGLSSGVSDITANWYSTCALTISGGVQCWGWNNYGQLGNGSTGSSPVPVNVSNLSSGVIAITAGAYHTCALTTSGGVKCWGYNEYGQLGNGSTTNSLTAVDVIGLNSGVAAVTAGYGYTCALTVTKGVKCWGDNGAGQLGNGNSTDSTSPVDVTGLSSGVIAIDAGTYHTCILSIIGSVKCWGLNNRGQLGNSIFGSSVTPVDVANLSNGIGAITAGDSYTCALTASSGVKCWGENYDGQLGNGSTISSPTPVDVNGLSGGISAIAAGYKHTCALTTGSSVKCWGDNYFGQLGNGGTTNSPAPVDVSGLSSGVRVIAAGYSHTCALMSSGGVKCWGRNDYGQLGNGGMIHSPSSVDVIGLSSGVSAIAAGNGQACALTTSGGVKCWGLTNSPTPVDVSGLDSGVSAIAVGSEYTCVLMTSGGVKCRGKNRYGQLGNGSLTNSTTPVDVNGLSNGVSAITTGYEHACALMMNGGIKCWGSNQSGQLGNGGLVDSSIPVDVSGLSSGVSAIAAAGWQTCALTIGGGVKCWGNNSSGQLGNGSTISSLTPVDVSGLGNGVSSIVMGFAHTCVLTTSGGVKCWGKNHSGQLGHGDLSASSIPVEVSGLSSGVSALSAGYAHSCAVTTSGNAKCWGNNTDGQLGDGKAWYTTLGDVVENSCYTLTLAHTGSGGDPIAYPGSSSGCNLGTYTSAEQIAVVANPTIDWHVSSWNGTNNDTSTAITNTLIMPASNYTVSVNYTTLLTPTATSTLTPTANPTDAPTPTPTNTPTVTPMSTSTVILTATATPTSTPIDTSTAVSTLTFASTFTPTATPTHTSTSTPTFTPTPTSSPTVTPTLMVSTKALVLIYAVLDNNLQSNWTTLVNNVERGVSAHTDVRLFVDGPGQNDAYIYDVKYDENDKCPTKFNPICGYTLNVDVHKGDESSAHPTTLTRFITESVALHPTASQLVVALVGHGSGWSAGVLPSTGQIFIDQPRPWVPQPTLTNDQLGALLWDDHPSTTLIGTHSLSIKGLDTALYAAQQITNRTIDLLYLDGCSLGMVEIAYEVKERAHYMIASPNTDWATFTYDRLLVNVNPALFNVRQLSEIWLQTDITFIRSASSDHPYPYTYALIDLTQLDQISKTTTTFADALIATLATDKIGIAEAFTRADHYESDYNGEINEDDAYTDLNSFAVEIEQQFPNNPNLVQAAKDVQLALSNVVVSKDSRASENWQSGDLWEWKNFGGLGIYLPLAWDEVRRFYYNQDHIMWAYGTTWDEFLTAYYQQPLSGMSASESARAPRPLATCELTTDENCNELAELLPLYEENQVYLPLISR